MKQHPTTQPPTAKQQHPTYRPLTSNLLVEFDSATKDYKTLPSGHRIYLPTAQGRIEEHASVVARVYATSEENPYNLAPGDLVAVAYHVVARYTLKDDGTTVYHNLYRLPNSNNHHTDQAAKGSQWVWLVRGYQIMATRKPDTQKWTAVGEWIMMQPRVTYTNLPVILSPDTKQFDPISSTATLTTEEMKAIGLTIGTKPAYACATYLSGQNDYDLIEGDVVHFDEGYRSTYNIEENEYIFLNKSRIIAKS